MSEYIRQRIEERRGQIASWQRQIELASAELRAYEDSLDHFGGEEAPRPKSTHRSSPPPPPAHWPGIIATLGRRGDSFTIDDVAAELAALGRTGQRKSIRSKLTELVKSGVLRRITDGVFSAEKNTAPNKGSEPHDVPDEGNRTGAD